MIFVDSTSGDEYLVVENSKGDGAGLDVLHNGNDLIEKLQR